VISRFIQLALLAAIVLLTLTPVSADTRIETDSLRLSFDVRGNLRSAIACFPSCQGENVRIQQFGDESVVRFRVAGSGDWAQSGSQTETHYQLDFRNGSGTTLSWKIPVRGYRLELNSSGVDAMAIRSGSSFRPREAAGFGNWLEQSRYAVIDSGEVTTIGLEDSEIASAGSDQWLGYRNRYWTLMAAPPSRVTAKLDTAEGNHDAGIETEAPDGEWTFYLGPVETNILKSAGAGLEQIMYSGLWFWLRWICIGMFHLLWGIHAFIPSWGLSVMILSLAVNLLMTPLSRIAQRLQDQVNDTEARLEPELRRIRKQFKGEEQSANILALYKAEGVHPLYSLKSLAGVAVVIPVFIGAFDMLAENIHLLNTGFLWIVDLSRPDDLLNLPFTVPFFGNELNALPFLMTGLSVVASILHNPLALNTGLRKKQVRNMLLLALAFFVLFYTFPAGMVLYWTTNNLISVIKSIWARR